MAVTQQDRQWSIETTKTHLARALHELEWLIMITPTGPDRDRLTAVNIHVMEAERNMKEVK
jgi:hypothetical protein